jgi:hypothetical protein
MKRAIVFALVFMAALAPLASVAYAAYTGEPNGEQVQAP